MKKMKVGVIACSGRGRNAWLAHRPEQGVEIVAGADLRKEALDEFKRKFPEASVFYDYRDLLKISSLDAVFISSPVEFHAQMASDALDSGKSVYLEKPMAETIEACDMLVSKARRSGLKLFVGHNLRYFPFMRELKRIIASGAIGDVKSIWCRHFVGHGVHLDDYFRGYSNPRFRYGLLLHKGCHDIDAIHWLGGAYSRKVMGIGSSSFFAQPAYGSGANEEQEDHNMILLELENGVQAAYLQCRFSPDDFRNYAIIGTKGRIENVGSNYGASSIKIWSNLNGRSEFSVTEVPCDGNACDIADKEIVKRFIECVQGDLELPVSPMDGRFAVATALMGRRSMRNGSSAILIPTPKTP